MPSAVTGDCVGVWGETGNPSEILLFFQARDEVIGILRAENIDLALLEAQYGFVTPKKVLEALQRDALQAKSAPWQEDIYERPMEEVSPTPGMGS